MRSSVMLATVALLAAPQETGAQAFPLTRALPADAFLVSTARHNPERSFVADYWGEVWQAFEDSGVAEDLFELVLTNASDDDRAHVERLVGRIEELVAGADWHRLGAEEFAFAERLGKPLVMRDRFFGGQPDMAALFRAEPEVTEQCYKALAGILDVLVQAIHEASGVELAVATEAGGDTSVTSLDLLQVVPSAPQLVISIGRHGDVLFVTYGAEIGSEVAKLLEDRSEQGGIAGTPRFRAAMASLPDPEDGIEYVDMQNLRDGLSRYADGIFAMVEQQVRGSRAEQLAVVKAVFDRVTGALGTFRYQATARSTAGFSTYADSVGVLAPDAAGRPFHAVIAASRPVADFAKFLPEEAVSFSVSGGFDAVAIYDYLEDAVAGAGKLGPQLVESWRGIQQAHGFDVRQDVLGWIDGETASVSLRLEDEDAWVWRMKVRDDQLARDKLAWVLDKAPGLVTELAGELPPLAMFLLRVEPSEIEGFHDVAVGMTPPIVVGVRNGWLVCGSSGEAVMLTEATAAGEHPNVLENEALMARAIVPAEGAVTSISYTEHGDEVEELAAMLSSMSMAGGMVAMFVPDRDAQQIIGRLFGIVAKLAPVVAKIDFFEASASCTTFDGTTWRTKSVTHYRPRQ